MSTPQRKHKFVAAVLDAMTPAEGGPLMPQDALLAARSALRDIPLDQVDEVCTQLFVLMRFFEEKSARQSATQLAILAYSALGIEAFKRRLAELAKQGGVMPERAKELLAAAQTHSKKAHMDMPKTPLVGVGARKQPTQRR
jgi:hypothetical protein